MAKKTSNVLGLSEMVIGGEIEKALFDFIVRVREGFRIADRCSQLSTGARNEQIKQKKTLGDISRLLVMFKDCLKS